MILKILNKALHKWLYSLFILLIIFSILRITFHVFNSDLFTKSGNKWDLLVVYFWGFRYDLTILFGFSLPVLGFSILQLSIFKSRLFERIGQIVTTMLYGGLIIVSVADIPYFRFNGRRATREVFSILEDSASAFSSFLTEYIGFVFLSLFLLYIVYRAGRKLITILMPFPLTVIISIVLLLLAINFGQPLTPKNATFRVDPANIALVTNTPYTLSYSLFKGQVTLPLKSYFESKEIRSSYFNIHRQLEGDSSWQKRNVVLFVLESFSREYLLDDHINKAPTPFLDSIQSTSMVFTNAFANGTTSAYGLMSILGGIPPFLDEPYFASIYGDNKLKGIGSLLNEAEYESHFFYGAEEDHYGFRKNMSLLGIDHYHSMADYNRQTTSPNDRNDHDGHWGIYDEPFFQYAAEELRDESKPFFATLFNISTHFPYMVPNAMRDELDQGTMTSHQSIAYTDHAIRKFFQAIDTTDWFKETIFVFVADHWAKMREIEDKSAVGIYRIPLFIYDPSDPVGRDIRAVTQQVDVVPILLDLMDYSGNWMSFGSSPLGDSTYRFTFNEYENIYRIIDSDFVLAYDENREATFSLHNYQEDRNLSNDLLWLETARAASMERYLLAVIQAYNNHLITNDVFTEPLP